MTQLAIMPTMPRALYGSALEAEPSVSATATEIREAIARWVGEDQLDIADALLAAGLSLHPDSEDILVMGVLLSQMRQEWGQAQMHIERLMAVQQGRATAQTWDNLIRILRCQEAFHAAYRAASKAVYLFPDHPALLKAQSELAVLLEATSASIGPAPKPLTAAD